MPDYDKLADSLNQAVDQLTNSWNQLGRFTDATKQVNVRTHLKASSLIQDIRGIARALCKAHSDRLEICKTQYAALLNIQNSDLKGILFENPDDIVSQTEFAACYKALFFFFRAYQDAILCILIEIRGEKSGRYTSMHDLFKKEESNELRQAIDKACPQYFPWFKRFRELRDKMKYGLNTSHGFLANSGEILVQVQTRQVHQNDGGGRTFAIEDELSLEDAVNACNISRELTEFAFNFQKARLDGVPFFNLKNSEKLELG